MADLYPRAPVYTSIRDSRATGDLVAPERVRTSALQRLPGAGRYFRYLAPLYPLAFEAFDLRRYDLIVSTTTSWAKGVRFRRDAVHVCYIHSVSRFVFDYQRYVGGFGVAALARPLARGLVAWDQRAAARPTAFIANSRNVAQRVRQYYGREAYVVHCPVDLDRFRVGAGDGDYFLVVSRLLAYKRVDLAIDACREAHVRLVIVGDGPARRALETRAAGSRTEFAGAVDDAVLCELMRRARAVIVPGEEDYGLVPLEANAAGRPVIAYARGGALETIRPGTTGEYFEKATPHSLAAVLARFDSYAYDPTALRSHAEAFSPAVFKERFGSLVARIREQATASRTHPQ